MTQHEPNHPEEIELNHRQRETKVIRGKSSQGRGWPKHVQGKCNRGDKCYYKHDDKAAAATKDAPKRTNSPAPKKDKKGKEPNAAPCLIDRCQKFACIAKTQLKATSRSVSDGSVSMKCIRFRQSVHFIEVPAVGHQNPVRHRPREYSVV